MHKLNRKVTLPILNESTCFEAIDMLDRACQRKHCKEWIDYEPGKNCVLLTVQNGPLTLREIGKIYGLTRMRICQIEKCVYQKIKEQIL
jgi:hypothetical protein